MKFIKIVVSALALLLSSASYAAIITDTVNQNEFVNWFGSYSYTHDLTEASDDPFNLGSAISGSLEVSVRDDSSSFWDGWEIILFTVEEFDFDTGGITFGSGFSGDLEVSALGALNLDGFLDITVSSVLGDFYVGNSVLTIETADVTSVPEPAMISLFGAGLIGLGFVRRRRSQK